MLGDHLVCSVGCCNGLVINERCLIIQGLDILKVFLEGIDFLLDMLCGLEFEDAFE